MLGKDSELAGPRGTTNPSNVQELNDAQSEGNYEDPRMACVEKSTVGSSHAKGFPARTQVLLRERGAANAGLPCSVPAIRITNPACHTSSQHWLAEKYS